MPDQNFCTEYHAFNSRIEVPRAFTMWCALSAVSCALGRRAWIDMGAFKVFPNLYVVLVAGAGQMRKSTAINIAKDLLYMLSPRPNFISQKLTTEFLLKTIVSPGNGTTIQTKPIGQGFALLSELTSFITKSTTDSGLAQILTQLYDCEDPLSYGTLTRGKEMLYSTQLGLLAATTPDELRKALPEDTIGSGLASRMIFVYDEEPIKPITFPTYSQAQLLSKEFCLRWLQRISSLSGQVILSDDCRAWCEDYYTDRCHNHPFYQDAHLRGYASRRFIHTLKLAICLNAGFEENLELSPGVLQSAENLLKLNERHLPKIVQLVTMNDKGSTINFVLQIISRYKTITQQDLLKLVTYRLDSRELIEITNTLKAAHQINVEVRGVSIVYSIRHPPTNQVSPSP